MNMKKLLKQYSEKDIKMRYTILNELHYRMIERHWWYFKLDSFISGNWSKFSWWLDRRWNKYAILVVIGNSGSNAGDNRYFKFFTKDKKYYQGVCTTGRSDCLTGIHSLRKARILSDMIEDEYRKNFKKQKLDKWVSTYIIVRW